MALEEKIRSLGYIPRRAEILALVAALLREGGPKVFLLEGPPGTGKTAFAEVVAKALEAHFVYTLLHSWSDDQELFCGVNVVAAVKGEANEVEQPGVLALAAQKSRQGLTVLCLDEVDKVQERTENLLLDFLQTGRVPVGPGRHLQADLDNLLVFLTSNRTRPLGAALLRRCRRVQMVPLSRDLQEELIVSKTGAPKGLVRVTLKVAHAMAQREGREPLSLQELTLLVRELLDVARSAEDCRLILGGWVSFEGQLPSKADIAPLWGELSKIKREEVR